MTAKSRKSKSKEVSVEIEPSVEVAPVTDAIISAATTAVPAPEPTAAPARPRRRRSRVEPAPAPPIAPEPADPAASVAVTPVEATPATTVMPVETAPVGAATADETTPAPEPPVAAPEPPPPLDEAAVRAISEAAVAAVEGPQPRNLAMALEALLFSTNVPLTEAELCEALKAEPHEVARGLTDLERFLAERPSSIALWNRAKGGQPAYILDVKAAFRRDVAVLAPPALRVALVETLALVALNQPVSQRRLVAERGSSVYEHVKELMELGYVQRQRRGINFFLRTTPGFAAEFGLPDQPEMIRQALAKAAGLAGKAHALASDRVWVEGDTPPEVRAATTEIAAATEAEVEARRAEEKAAAQRAEEEAATRRAEEELARLARIAEEEAARSAALEAQAAAEAARKAEMDEAARAETARAALDEATRLEEARRAIEARARQGEDCLVAGAEASPIPVPPKSKKRKKVEDALAPEPLVEAPREPDPIRDFLSQLSGGTEAAW